MNKKDFILLVLFLILSNTAMFAGAIISQFEAVPGFNKVEIKWVVTFESNVDGYELHRSKDGTKYDKIKFIEAKASETGEKTYTYTDDKVFKSNGSTWHYKLKIVESNGQIIEYDKTCTVDPKISAARHTWGSIKAMFR